MLKRTVTASALIALQLPLAAMGYDAIDGDVHAVWQKDGYGS